MEAPALTIMLELVFVATAAIFFLPKSEAIPAMASETPKNALPHHLLNKIGSALLFI